MTKATPPLIPLRNFRIILPMLFGCIPIGILLRIILNAVPAVRSAAAPCFVCCSGNPARVVYILDLSNEAKIDDLRRSLIDSIWQLDVTAGQTFDVLASGDASVSPFGHGAVLSTSDNKKLAVDFVNNCAGRASLASTVHSIHIAFADHPDRIYYFGNGSKDPAFRVDVVSSFTRLNHDRHAHVNTVIGPGTDSRLSFDMMHKIAADNGGKLIVLRPSDISQSRIQ